MSSARDDEKTPRPGESAGRARSAESGERAAVTRDDRASVLLVDDKPENLLALRSILGTSLYRLVSAGSGAEALRAVLEEDFAVIVLDVLMPEMDGFEVASTIKLRTRSRRTPIIFLTAAGTDLGLDGRGYEVGAVDYLSKPISPAVLRAKVSVFADLFRKTQEIARQAELLRQAELRERDRRMADIERQHEVRYQRLADSIPHLVWRADGPGAAGSAAVRRRPRVSRCVGGCRPLPGSTRRAASGRGP